ncbi:MAG: hypothetical protein V5A45_15845, partial [Haloarculaceae archaeon]
ALTNTSMTWEQAGGSSGDVTAGSSVTIMANTTASTDFAGDTIRVIYNSPDADNTATLGKFEVPS